jgi:hypothetical protein
MIKMALLVILFNVYGNIEEDICNLIVKNHGTFRILIKYELERAKNVVNGQIHLII